MAYANWWLLAPVWLWVCYTDWRYRRIDNWVIVYLVLAGVTMLHLSGSAAMPVLKQSVVVLAVGYLAWQLDLVGAGDAKLFFGMSLWHVGEMAVFVLYMSIIGAAVALPYLVLRASRRRHGKSPDRGVPYGIAIVLASAVLHA